MPLFEYQCKTCGLRFETLVAGSRKPVCPRCAGEDLEKQFSTFGMGRSERGVGARASSGPSCSTGGG